MVNIQMERRPAIFPIELGGQILQAVDITNILLGKVFRSFQFLSKLKFFVKILNMTLKIRSIYNSSKLNSSSINEYINSDWPGRSVPYHMGAGSEHVKRYLPEMRWSRQGLLGGLAINTRAVSG